MAPAAAFLFMAWISWRRWPDLLIDYGQQLYVAWRIAEGDVLYRDLFYIYGPLASYLNGFLFYLFGSGMMVLAWFNLGLIAVMGWLLYRLLERLGDSLTACIGVLVFFLVFAFGHFELLGTYNFVTPYVYDLTYGVFLGLAALYGFMRYLENQNGRWLAATGFATGLVFMTKTEVFVALAPALLVAVAVTFRKASDSPAAANRKFAGLVAGMAAPLLITFLLVAWRHDPKLGWDFLWLHWHYVGNPEFRTTPMYQGVLGFDHPGRNLGRMGLQTLVFAILVSALWAVQVRLKSGRARTWALAAALAAAAACYVLKDQSGWLQVLRSLPVLVLGLGVWMGISVIAVDQPAAEFNRRVLLLAFSIFALILMGKMILRVHVFHYGFALALPATLVALQGCLHEAPRLLQMKCREDRLFRFPLYVLLIAVVMMMVSRSLEHYAQKQEQLQSV